MTLPALPPPGRVARRLDLLVCLLAFSVVAVAWTAVRYDLGFVFGASFVVPVALAVASLSLPVDVRRRRGIGIILGATLAGLSCALAPSLPHDFLIERGLYATGSILPSSPVESGSSHDLVVDIIEIERRTSDYVRALVSVISVDSHVAPEGLRAVAFFDPRTRVSTGDRISTRTRWRVPSGYDSPSYRRYLLGRGVYGSLSAGDYRRLGEGVPTLPTVFEPARERVRALAHELYPPDTAVLALGVLAGDRADMPDELRERFVRSGLSHLLVVSGFNIAILALALSFIFARLPALPRAVIVCLGIA